METITLERSGSTPIRFNGELLASAGGVPEKVKRGHVVKFFRVDAGGREVYAASVEYLTEWRDEPQWFAAAMSSGPGDLAEWLLTLNIDAHVSGYPPGAQFVERQKRLLSDLRAAYIEAVRIVMRHDVFKHDMLTKNEKMALADAFNGISMAIYSNPRYMECLTNGLGSVDVCSGMEHQMWDFLDPNEGGAEKWEISRDAMIKKIRRLTPKERAEIITRIGEVWERNDDNFVPDLESLML
jgi:hypothetical protein